jgi:PPOX class probable F420-dependent enzyme
VPTIGLRREQGSDQIPASRHDLIQCPPVAALTTVMPDGHPQTSVVWCDFDGVCVRVNTMRGFAKERNMRRNLRVTLLCYDPRQPMRYLEVRGTVVELTEAGAAEYLNHLAARRLLDHPEDAPFVVDDCECPRPEHRLTLPG